MKVEQEMWQPNSRCSKNQKKLSRLGFAAASSTTAPITGFAEPLQAVSISVQRCL
jgi:hypothetical protein